MSTDSRGETSGEDWMPIRSNELPRKATYYARKDEIQSLRDQVRSLEAKLQAAIDARESYSVNKSIAVRVLLDKSIQQQQLTLAGAQSLLSSYNSYRQCPSSPIPLKTLIHLPADALHRSAVLSSLREPKLLAAFQFMAARTRFHDLRVAHHQCEQSRLLTGEIVATVFTVVQFDGGHSVRQVYDAYQTFMNNQEISVSETLGVLTICENDAGSDDAGSSQMRFVSTPWEGLEVDSNLVRFETYSDATVDSPDAYALGTFDYVDHDDLYPYQPHRGRKDMTNAWLLVQVPSTTDQRMVAMARWSHTRFRPPLGPLPKDIEAVVTSGVLHWCDLMPKIMADLLATQTPAL